MADKGQDNKIKLRAIRAENRRLQAENNLLAWIIAVQRENIKQLTNEMNNIKIV